MCDGVVVGSTPVDCILSLHACVLVARQWRVRLTDVRGHSVAGPPNGHADDSKHFLSGTKRVVTLWANRNGTIGSPVRVIA